MTSIRIQELELRDEEVEAKVHQLVGRVFGRELAPGAILRNTFQEFGTHRTRYLGAFRDDALVGFAAFLAHRFTLNGEPLHVHQRCWSSVDPTARGEGVFSTLVDEAKALLAVESTLLMAFPNANSAGVTAGRLGFTLHGGFRRLTLPASRLLVGGWVRRSVEPAPVTGVVEQDHEALAELKRVEGRHPVFTLEGPGGNHFWGIIRGSSRFTGRIRVAALGGVHLRDPGALGAGLHALVRALDVHLLEISAHERSALVEHFRGMGPVPEGPPLAILPLHPLPEIRRWNLSLGVLDAF